jgi:3-hydroxybutyryl-CoA dehydratase
MSDQLYADDFRPGEQFTGNWHTVDEKIVDMFARMTGDDHPIHYDAEYAKQTRFGQPVVHGLLIAALTALGATEMSARLRDSMVALIGIKADFVAPLFVGQRVRPSFVVLQAEPRPGKSTARVVLGVEMHSQSGEVCLRGEHTYILKRRGAPSSHGSSPPTTGARDDG